jgi:hypothetical protein
MRVLVERPPNYDRLLEHFPGAARAFFAWGDIIYNPHSIALTPALLAHERVHGMRQNMVKPQGELSGIEVWWEGYIQFPEFRLEEEVEAHIVEYKVLCQGFPNRAARRRNLVQLAARLSGPLYGRLISLKDAKARILNADGV